MIENKIKGLITKVVIRLRVQHFAEGFATGAVPALALAGLGMMLNNAGWASYSVGALSALAGLPFVWGALYAAFLKPNHQSIAVQLDEANALEARLTSAYCFSETPKAERTAFMEATIKDAASKIADVDVSPAAPFSIPRDALAMGAATLCLLTFFLTPEEYEPLPPVVEVPLPEPEAILDDASRNALVESWKEEREKLMEDESPQGKELVKEMDDLYDKLEKRELKKEDFFSEVDRINDKFFKDEKSEFTSLEDELKDLSTELDDNKETKDLAEALKKGDLDKAAAEVEKIAEKVASGKMKDKDIDKIAKNLEKMGDKLDAAAEKLAKELKENKAAQEALKKKGEEMSQKDKQKLSRLGRDFEKLKKMFDFFEGSGKRKAKKKISKGLKKAADGMRKAKKRGKDAAKGKEAREQAKRDLKQGAKAASSEMKHTKKKASGEKSKKKAKNNLDRLKESVKRSRKQKPGGQKKGNKGQEQGKKGQQGEGQQGKKPGQDGKKPGQDGESKQAKKGKPSFEKRAGGKKPGDEGEEGKKGKAGQPGKPAGKASAQPASPDGKDGKKGQQRGENDGDKASDNAKKDDYSKKGKGGDALGKETELDGAGFKSASVSGKDSGKGASKAEVIASAAEKGFATEQYADVHAEYEHVAEEALEKESIPAGYRFYIQSYFDRIRPREADE